MKPNTALGFELFEIGASVGGEQERDLVLAPRATGRNFFRLQHIVAAVAFGLSDRAGNIYGLFFGFDNRNGHQTDEQDVVSRPARRWPFGDGDVLALLRALACRMADLFGVYNPAGGL